jgi:hypothetical protein
MDDLAADHGQGRADTGDLGLSHGQSPQRLPAASTDHGRAAVMLAISGSATVRIDREAPTSPDRLMDR